MKLTVNAPAKINLTLDIIGRRNDGYHLVKMLMQSVDVCDTVTVWDDADSPIQVFCNREEIPVSEANTAYRAAQAFFEAAKIENPCIGIKIKKRIPMAAGLAGGSADAAAVIVALDRMFETRLSEAELTDIGERVGAECAVLHLRRHHAGGGNRHDSDASAGFAGLLYRAFQAGNFRFHPKGLLFGG